MFEFACPSCDTRQAVTSTDDEIPDIYIKIRRVQRSCLACGEKVDGLNHPDECPNDDCPDPGRGWREAEKVVTEAITIPICVDCQDRIDTEGEIRSALFG